MGFDSHSSESDEDNNVRHDRFKSERFQSEKPRSLDRKDNKYSKQNEFQSNRHRDRSPRRHRHREGIASSSSHRHQSKYDSRSDLDRKDRGKKSYSKSSKSDKKDNQSSENLDKESPETKSKKNLSSILKKFDQQVESKRSVLEDSGPTNQDIGPVLPPHLKQTNECENDSDQEKHAYEYLKETDLLPPPNKVLETECSNTNKDSKCFGVELPPHLKDKYKDIESSNTDTAEDSVLPLQSLDQHKPSCTDSLETSTNESSTNDKASEPTPDNCDSCLAFKNEPETYGPALPPKVDVSAYGPALPPKMQPSSFGPSLPPEFKNNVESGVGMEVEQNEEESDDEDTVGPLPDGKMSLTQYQLDLRAASLRKQLEEEVLKITMAKNGSSKDVKKREEWMLELPPEKASNLGLGPRNFRKREGPDMSNRSDWTDTPADRQRKAELAQSGIVVEPVNSEEVMKSAFVKERNEAMDKISKKSKEEDRPRSLLELHQKKLKKKKKNEEKDGKKKERRPFDRNIDLQVNRFDDAQKKAIFKKAQLLDTRFSTGESKYL